jgi:DNA repair ATPase RecN
MRAVAGFAFVAAVMVSAASWAQSPPPPPPPPGMAPMPPVPPSPEADAIRECLCLQQSMERASSEMTDKRNSLDRINAELRQTDADLERQRAALNVNDPQAVAQFRQRLEQRDGLFKRSTGPIVNDVTASVERYNHRVAAYNQQCANRPFNSVLQAQVQATLSCPVE